MSSTTEEIKFVTAEALPPARSGRPNKWEARLTAMSSESMVNTLVNVTETFGLKPGPSATASIRSAAERLGVAVEIHSRNIGGIVTLFARVLTPEVAAEVAAAKVIKSAAKPAPKAKAAKTTKAPAKAASEATPAA